MPSAAVFPDSSVPFHTNPGFPSVWTVPFHVNFLTRAPFALRTSAVHVFSFVQSLTVTGITSWLLSPSGENTDHGISADRYGAFVSSANEGVVTDAVDAFADVISRDAVYRPSAQIMPLSSFPSHTNDDGTVLFSLTFFTFFPAAFETVNTYFMIPPLPARATGVKVIVSFTLSLLGEKADEEDASMSVASVVSRLNGSERITPVFPARSVAESSNMYDPFGAIDPLSSNPFHTTVSAGNSPSVYSFTAFVRSPDA